MKRKVCVVVTARPSYSRIKSALCAIQGQLQNGRYKRDCLYGDGKAGERIADLLSTVSFNISKRLPY
jgi:hypothetical protein